MPLWSRKGDLGGLVHHSDAGANTPRSATPSAWPRPASCRRSARSAIPTTTPCRVGRRPLHDRSDPPNRSVEGDRRRRVRDAGVGGLVQPPTPARADRPRPAVGVRGRQLGQEAQREPFDSTNPASGEPRGGSPRRLEPGAADLARLMVASRWGCVGMYRSAYLDSGNPTDRGGTRVPRTGELKSQPR